MADTIALPTIPLASLPAIQLAVGVAQVGTGIAPETSLQVLVQKDASVLVSGNLQEQAYNPAYHSYLATSLSGSDLFLTFEPGGGPFPAWSYGRFAATIGALSPGQYSLHVRTIFDSHELPVEIPAGAP